MEQEKVKSFPPFPTHWKFTGSGSKLLDLSFSRPPLSVNTGIIFSFSTKTHTKLQSRLWNCYPQLSSSPVFSKIDSFCWVYKYKTEPTTALKSCGQMHQQLWALLAQTSWPGSTGHSSGKDSCEPQPGKSILMQTFKSESGESLTFPQESEGVSISVFAFTVYYPV